MKDGHNPKLRFGVTLSEVRDSTFRSGIANAPPLPIVNYALVGKQAPSLPTTPVGRLPKVSTVVITWADAEWAALEHVFCAGSDTMPYGDRSRSMWAGWEKYSQNLPSGRPSNWTYWGYYRLVEIGQEAVLLFKSNTHLDWPGPTYLRALIKLLAAEAKPGAILSIGTAGGAKPQDHIGTVRAVSAGTLFERGQPQVDWPEYSNGWKAREATLANADFKRLLLPVPTKMSDLQALCSQFNGHYGTDYTLAQLDPNQLNLGEATPRIDDETGGEVSLLTTPTFAVGTTAGNYQTFTSIEMDDAVVGETCASNGIAFGFVRNISDPVQSEALPAKVQGNWGSAVYDTYGFYTSYNGAIATWAMLA